MEDTAAIPMPAAAMIGAIAMTWSRPMNGRSSTSLARSRVTRGTVK